MGDRTWTRVLVVEDSLVAREGMVAIIQALPGAIPAATAATVAEAREEVEALRPDVVLTDIRMPPGHHDEGIALAEELARAHPDIPVIVVSQFCEPPLAARLFAHHAAGRGYLLKDRIADPATLGEAIAEVRGGGTVIDPSLTAGMVVDGRGQRNAPPTAGLTPREAEVLGMVADGMSNSAIARAIGISRKGVEKNVSQIFAKLGLGADGDTSPRVAATLMWLRARDDRGSGSAA